MGTGLESAASILRTVHIAAGVVALSVFVVPLVVQKGNRIHRRVGWIYVYAMAIAGFTAITIAPLRLLQRPTERWGAPLFLAYVGLLSFTAAFYGVRVLRQKKRTTPHRALVDWFFPIALLASSAAMLIYGVASGFILAAAFTPLGVLTALPQIKAMRAQPPKGPWWLAQHLTAMGISCIATVTAFLVVNTNRYSFGGSPIVWFSPAAILIPLIIVWRRRYKKGNGATQG